MSAQNVLDALGHDRARVDLILDRLGLSRDHTERADLAAELVKSCSRCEDVKARVLYPALESRPGLGRAVRKARRDQEKVRGLMAEMRERTRGTSPRDVHVPDPAAVDEQIDQLADSIGRHLQQEDAEVFVALDDLDPLTSDLLAEQVARAVDRAVEHPRPPGGKVGRRLADLASRVDHVFEDAPTASHPARDHLPPQNPPGPAS